MSSIMVRRLGDEEELLLLLWLDAMVEVFCVLFDFVFVFCGRGDTFGARYSDAVGLYP